MAKRAVIVHGWGGNPKEGWFPWLKKNLEERGFSVEVPIMPDTDYPKIEPWVLKLSETIGATDQEIYLIGHSMGGQTILRYLEQLSGDERVNHVVLVASFITLKGLTEEEKVIAQPWLEIPIDLNRVRMKAKKFTAIFSTNDPWVPMDENSKLFKEKLGAEIVIEHSKGHFSGSDGVTELPSVLKVIS